MNKSLPFLFISSGLLLLISGLAISFQVSKIQSSNSTANKTSSNTAIIRVPLPESALELDPRIQLSINLKSISNAAFSRLVRINEVGEVEPDLAESWSFDLAKSEVLIKIRAGVRFHDGSSLTLEDVIASMETWLNPGALDNNLLFDVVGAEEFSRGKAGSVDGIRKVDQFTIGVRLKKQFTEDFIIALATHRFYIYQKLQLQSGNIRNGTGPFKFSTTSTIQANLAKNDQYFGEKAKAAGLFFYSAEKETAIEDLMNGKAHALFAYSDFTKTGWNNRLIKVLPIKKSKTSILFFMYQGKSKSLEYRKRIASTFQKEKLLAQCFPESFTAQRIIPPGLRGSVALTPKSLNAQNSVTTLLGLPILYSTTMESRCLFDQLRKDYSKIGGTIREFSSLELLYEHFLKGQVDFALERLTFKSLDPSSVLQYFNPRSSEYFLREEIPELTQLFGALSDSENSTQKYKVLAEIDAYLVDNFFVVPLIHETYLTAHSTNLTGLSLADFGSIAGVKWEQLGLTEQQ